MKNALKLIIIVVWVSIVVFSNPRIASAKIKPCEIQSQIVGHCAGVFPPGGIKDINANARLINLCIKKQYETYNKIIDIYVKAGKPVAVLNSITAICLRTARDPHYVNMELLHNCVKTTLKDAANFQSEQKKLY